MLFFTKRQFIKDIVQNHKDAPNLWKYRKVERDFTNVAHNLRVNFYDSKAKRIFRVYIKDITFYCNDLTWAEKYYLETYFSKVLNSAYPITVPTKQTHPEEFI